MTITYDYPVKYSKDVDLRNFYEENGFVSIKSGIPLEDINLIKKELEEVFTPFATDSKKPFDSAVIELDKNNKDQLYELHILASKLTSFSIVNSRISKYINAICGKPVPKFEINTGFLLGIPSDKRLVYDFHQESNYMKGFDNIFNIHYPLMRTSNLKNGTMSVLSGSHKLGTLNFKKSRISHNSYTDLIPEGIDKIKKSFNEVFNFLELGDVVIFHKDLIHKSNSNFSKLTRPVGVSRLTTSYGGNFKYLTPKDL